MTNITFRKILWMNDPGHDKLWCSFEINNRIMCAWGRRGKKLQFKDHGSANIFVFGSQKIKKLEREKEQKGYREVDNFYMFSMFPNFEDELESQLLLATLGDKIK